jgi:hypothetical protein
MTRRPFGFVVLSVLWVVGTRHIRAGAPVRLQAPAAVASAPAAPDPGRLPAFQRLTRTEYWNAIRDLLGISALPNGADIDLLLPPDSASSGFDNFRDLLYVSSTQLEQYLSAAKKISRLALGQRSLRPFVDVYNTPTQPPQDVAGNLNAALART